MNLASLSHEAPNSVRSRSRCSSPGYVEAVHMVLILLPHNFVVDMRPYTGFKNHGIVLDACCVEPRERRAMED